MRIEDIMKQIFSVTCSKDAHELLRKEFKKFEKQDFVGKVAKLYRPKLLEITSKYDELYVDIVDIKICFGELDKILTTKMNKSMLPML